MSLYIARRMMVMLPMLIGITIVAFVFMNVAPGDPVTAMIDPQQGSGGLDVQAVREAFGLDKPLPIRYAIWLREVVSGNIGYSYRTGQPVLRRIAERIPATLELTLTALAISTVVGCALGICASLKRYSIWDYGLTVLTLVWTSVPGYFIGLVALYVFALRVPILPSGGMVDPLGAGDALDNLKHLLLPSIVLSLEALAGTTRYTRTAMLDVLRDEFMTTARAKGLGPWAITIRHAFRNALLPVITITSLRIPLLLGGAVVIEAVFQWPGMGTLAIASIQQRDYPVLMGLTLIISSMVLASNLLADLLYAYADPRIRYA